MIGEGFTFNRRIQFTQDSKRFKSWLIEWDLWIISGSLLALLESAASVKESVEENFIHILHLTSVQECQVTIIGQQDAIFMPQNLQIYDRSNGFTQINPHFNQEFLKHLQTATFLGGFAAPCHGLGLHLNEPLHHGDATIGPGVVQVGIPHGLHQHAGDGVPRKVPWLSHWLRTSC